MAPAREWERRQAEYSPPPIAPRPPRTVAEIAAVWVPIGVAALSVLGSLAVVAHTASQTLATHDLRIANLETGAKEHSASDEKKMGELEIMVAESNALISGTGAVVIRDREHYGEDADGAVLTREEGFGAFADGVGDDAHLRCAGVAGDDLGTEAVVERVGHRDRVAEAVHDRVVRRVAVLMRRAPERELMGYRL